MNEDTTRDLPARSFEERMLAELAAFRAEFRTEISALNMRLDAVEDRLTMLGERVDMRLRATRPIWEGMQEQLQRLNTKLDIFFGDFNELRTQQAIVLRRMDKLETAAPSQP